MVFSVAFAPSWLATSKSISILHLALIAFLALPSLFLSASAYQFPDGQVQPGCYPPPALPPNYSVKPELWRLATSWRGSKKRLGRRQSAGDWNGWSSVKYLFTLFVIDLPL